MKNYIFIFSILLLSHISFCISEKYSYRPATPSDLLEILKLMKIAEKDSADKIVLLPEKFREIAIKSAIEKNRFFVATNENSEIVAFKKLFCVTDITERDEILNDELCFNTEPIASLGVFDADTNQTVFIYNGGDYTNPADRKKGINQCLTRCALQHAKKSIDLIKHNNAYLALIYGLTNANAGNDPRDIQGGRTRSIQESFHEVFKEDIDSKRCVLTRYLAYMPQFDQTSKELTVLPKEQSIAGVGCRIVAPLLIKK